MAKYIILRAAVSPDRKNARLLRNRQARNFYFSPEKSISENLFEGDGSDRTEGLEVVHVKIFDVTENHIVV